MTYDTAMPQVFPWWAWVTPDEAAEIARILTGTGQRTHDGIQVLSGSSFAVIGGTSRYNFRQLWVSAVSRSRLEACGCWRHIRWHNSALE